VRRFWISLTLMLGLAAPSLLTIAQQTVINEIFPQVAVNGDIVKVVWQEVQLYDLFQRPIQQPWLPDSTIGVNIYQPLNGFPRSGAARPKISANTEWLVYHDEQGRVRVWDITGTSPVESTLIIGWQDSDNNGRREEPQNYDAPSGVFPAISESGRFVAFLSQRRNLNDPNGDGNGPNTPELNGDWTIYIHDRDADIPQDLNNDGFPDVQGTQGTFDEDYRGATTTRFLPNPNNLTLPFRLSSPTRLRHIALEEANNVLRIYVTWVTRVGPNWELRLGRWEWDLQNRYWINVSESQVWVSNIPIQGGFVSRGRVAFSISNFAAVIENGTRLLQINTNGVNGAPVLSRDGNLLAFHSTMTAYRVNGGNWLPLITKRNAVDDIFVLDLKGQLLWSTLAFRQVGTIPPYAACINPNLTDLKAIAFQQVTPILPNGQVYVSRVRIVQNGAPVR
ncbi:MAG: hypothetical protein NZ937_05925, partial [Armatimonadetes bacterium]|nr:hypothetical protein [Armatimonadota bacterium]